MRRVLFLTAALSLAAAWPAGAQNLKLDFQDGRVSVEATSVPVRTILTEWGRIGGTKIIGADRITGAPLSVKLINVTEADALETILRSVAGYMAAPRGAGAGSSMYDRILVMATSTAPAPAAAATNARPGQQPNNALGGTQRFIPPQRPRPDEQPEADEADEPDENPPSPPVFTFPQPGQNGPPQFQNAPGISTGQPGVTVNPANGGPPNVTINPAPGQPTGPIGSPRPGMIINPNPPQPNAPVPPGTMIRPPPRGGG